MTERFILALLLTKGITTQPEVINVTESALVLTVSTEQGTFPHDRGCIKDNNDTCQQSDIPTWSSVVEEEELTESEENLKRQFQEVESFLQKYYFAVVNVLGMFACITTITVLHRGGLSSSASVFLRGISSANLVTLVLQLIWIINRYPTVAGYIPWRNFYSYYLAYIYRFHYVAIAANAWIIIAFAVERFIAITYPLKAHIITSKSRAKKIVVALFTVALFCNLTRFFSVAVTTQTDSATNETLHVWYYTEFGADPVHIRVEDLFYAIAVVFIPVIVLSILNVSILLKLRLSRKTLKNLQEGNVSSRQTQSAQIDRVLIASLSAFLVCNVLFSTSVLTVAIYGNSIFSSFNFGVRLRFLVSESVYVLNPLLNFLLYVCCSKSMRTAVVDLFRCGKTTKRNAVKLATKTENITYPTELAGK